MRLGGTFHDVDLNTRLLLRDAEPQGVFQIINLSTVEHWLRLDGNLVTELYVSGVRQPMTVGFKTSEIERLMLRAEPGEQ